jgi:hypothetical protein
MGTVPGAYAPRLERLRRDERHRIHRSENPVAHGNIPVARSDHLLLGLFCPALHHRRSDPGPRLLAVGEPIGRVCLRALMRNALIETFRRFFLVLSGSSATRK